MKIAHIFKDFWPPLAAGITRYIADVADASARRGNEVEVHVAGVHTSRRDVLPSGVVVHRHREFGRLLSSPLAPGLMLEGRRLRVDVVHVHLPNPVGEVAALLCPSSTRLVTSFHARLGRQRFLTPAYGPLQRRVLNRSAVVMVSSEVMTDAPELRGFAGKVRVMPFGVSPMLTPTTTGPHQGTESTTLRVLFVGRLVYYKGVEVLLRAAASVKDIDVTIVGEGPLRADLQRLAGTLGITDTVRFLGQIGDDELREAYRDHDVFVLPSVSRAEAFGLATVEAMASGLPAVTTRLGTATDWVNQDGVSGLVVTPGDIEALADALRQLQSPIGRQRLGTGARRRVTELFSFESHCNALFAAYEGR